MKKFVLFLMISMLLMSGTAFAVPVFTVGSGAVTSADRSATFDPLVGGQSLLGYTENNLIISIDDDYYAGDSDSWWGPGFSGDRHYGSGGNYSFVSISTTDSLEMYALEMALSDGWYDHGYPSGTGLLHIYWQTWRNSSMTGSGTGNNLVRGTFYGFSDVDGIDELRIAAYANPGTTSFGGYNAIAIDNLGVQMNPIPEPATMLLLGSGLIGLAAIRRRFKKG